MFGQDLQELPYQEYNVDEFKVPNVTAFTLRQTQSYKSPTNFQNHSFPQPFDSSLDHDIYNANAQMIRKTIIQYLKNCTTAHFNNNNILHSHQFFTFEKQDLNPKDEENTIESLLYQNRLLTETEKLSLKKKIKEFQELSGVVQELNQYLGKQLAQEVIYILFILLDIKIEGFRQLVNKEDDGLLPKIQRFWGDEENQQIFQEGWAVYEQIDEEQIKKFASEGVEEYAMKLYFSGKLKYITLQEVRCDLKDNINVADKFATLMIHLSRIFFLNLSGMAQSQDNFAETSSDLSFDLIQDKITEKLSKRIKMDI